MDWIRAVFSGENSAITLVVIVVGLALALVLLAWVFRKIAGDGSLKAGRNRQPRLSVTDAAIVDDKRRLVLVRRDNVEHLVMIGGPTDVVIEPNISRAAQPHHVSEAAATAKSRTAEKQVEAYRRPMPAAKPMPQRVPDTVADYVEDTEAVPPPAATVRQAMTQRAEQEAQQAPATVQDSSQIAELELSEEELAAEIAASEEMVAATAVDSNSVNGRSAASATDQIEIDLAELQSEIDRSQDNVEPDGAHASAQGKVPAPSLDGAELEKVVPERKSPEKTARAETKQEPKFAADPATLSSSRVKNMEDEMQRLLEELSGPARN